MPDINPAVTYGSYLKLDELLSLQQPRSDGEHDEMLFIVIHQVYELWFKELLHELDRVVSADRLVELLWGEDLPKAMSSLQAYVSRLRSILEPSRLPRDPATVLITQPPGYRLVVAREDVGRAGRR